VALSQRANDSILGIGWVSAFFWCGSQALRALTSIKGVSLAQYLAFGLGFAVQFLLAVAGYRKQPSRLLAQLLVVFGTWTILAAMLVMVVSFGTPYRWSYYDSTIAWLSAIGLGLVAIYAIPTHVSITDAAIKGLINIVLKSIPQFLLVETIWHEGSSAISIVAIVTGHISIVSRLGPMLWHSKGSTREQKWLMVTDAFNLVSWAAVTMAWYFN
jgi:hypothetical protein